ncbi:YtxH domain-containing protein [Chryseolinea sp. H1M3-3]|jgi:gas vesicle protein|uniref:YtxH domain-containing protein n=1 Tax=Chryseolinea sp. H1M3-3 TaxID=3034144 RepID=UPI0023ED9C2E|nr:YtxH domain-containing protein [Chryseolinea sp. H1M3-3]
MKITTQVILGFAAAAVAGAAIGMLLAPEKGKDLQMKIKDGAQDWLNQFSSLLNTGRDVAAQVKSIAQQEVQHLKSELNEVH